MYNEKCERFMPTDTCSLEDASSLCENQGGAFAIFFVSKKNQSFIILVIVPVSCSELAKPSPQLAPRHTVLDCIGSESMASSVNSTESMASSVNSTEWGFERRLPRLKARTSTTRPSEWSFVHVSFDN